MSDLLQVQVDQHGLRFFAPSLNAGGIRLLEAFDVSIPKGKVMLIKGPNGSGKSTLLRQLGNVLGKRAISFKPPFCLRNEVSVNRQAEAFLGIGGQGGLSLNATLEKVGLVDWGGDQVRGLSTGQRARLGFVLLDISDQAPVWLLDEPVNALDFQALEMLKARVGDHLRKGGIVILAAHLGAEQLLLDVPISDRFVYHLSQGGLHLIREIDHQPLESGPSGSMPVVEGNTNFRKAIRASFSREYRLSIANAQQFYWAGLYLLMTISFFAFALKSPKPESGLAVTWVGVILATLLTAKDWFSEDQRCGWVGLVVNRGVGEAYWLGKVILVWLSLSITSTFVSFAVAVFFGLSLQTLGWLVVSLWAGLSLAVPLASFMALLVELTKGGAVLVYLLALPVLLPVLVFGLETAGAVSEARSPWSALGVLVGAACIAILVGPKLVNRLMHLIQE